MIHNSNPRSSPWKLLFRMQTEAPDIFDLSKESEATRQAYGRGHFARGCLMARRLVDAECGACRFTSTKAILGTS